MRASQGNGPTRSISLHAQLQWVGCQKQMPLAILQKNTKRQTSTLNSSCSADHWGLMSFKTLIAPPTISFSFMEIARWRTACTAPSILLRLSTLDAGDRMNTQTSTFPTLFYPRSSSPWSFVNQLFKLVIMHDDGYVVDRRTDDHLIGLLNRAKEEIRHWTVVAHLKSYGSVLVAHLYNYDVVVYWLWLAGGCIKEPWNTIRSYISHTGYHK